MQFISTSKLQPFHAELRKRFFIYTAPFSVTNPNVWGKRDLLYGYYLILDFDKKVIAESHVEVGNDTGFSSYIATMKAYSAAIEYLKENFDESSFRIEMVTTSPIVLRALVGEMYKDEWNTLFGNVKKPILELRELIQPFRRTSRWIAIFVKGGLKKVIERGLTYCRKVDENAEHVRLYKVFWDNAERREKQGLETVDS